MMINYESCIINGGAIILAIILVILLVFAISIIHKFYICDNRKCYTFQESGYNKLSDKQTLKNIMTHMYHQNSVWSFAIIPSIILALCIPWIFALITGYESFNMLTILIVFVICFLFIYAILQFIAHHYLKPIAKFVLEVIANNNTET